AQQREWNHDASIDWHLLDQPLHAGISRWVSDLNRAYRSEPALHELDVDPVGFRWVQIDDADEGTVSYLRIASTGECVLIAINLTPVPRHDHVLGVPVGGRWQELLNSDAEIYGGSGLGNLGEVTARPESWADFDLSVSVTLPPLAVVVLKAVS